MVKLYYATLFSGWYHPTHILVLPLFPVVDLGKQPRTIHKPKQDHGLRPQPCPSRCATRALRSRPIRVTVRGICALRLLKEFLRMRKNRHSSYLFRRFAWLPRRLPYSPTLCRGPGKVLPFGTPPCQSCRPSVIGPYSDGVARTKDKRLPRYYEWRNGAFGAAVSRACRAFPPATPHSSEVGRKSDLYRVRGSRGALERAYLATLPAPELSSLVPR